MRRRVASIQRLSLIILLRRAKFSSSLRSRLHVLAISMTLLSAFLLSAENRGAAFSPNFFSNAIRPESQFRFPSIKLAEYRGLIAVRATGK